MTNEEASAIDRLGEKFDRKFDELRTEVVRSIAKQEEHAADLAEARHTLYGDDTDANPGLVKRVDRLRQLEKRIKASASAAWSAVVAVLVAIAGSITTGIILWIRS